MTELFIRLCNMSISAGWLVLAAVVLRLFLRKGPRWILPVLWGIVGLRLLLPFSVESIFSLLPSAETIAPEIVYAAEPTIHSGVYALNSVVNPMITETFAPVPGASVNPLQIWLTAGAVLWIIGMTGMLAYAVISWLRLGRKMAESVRLEGNIYESDRTESPFVLGLFRPKVYLPFGLPESVRNYVIAHEQAHIRRKDHWIKPIGFVLLAIHWFNPLIWLAYVLLCRDIELACDERVIRDLDEDSRADYSEALLSCSMNRRSIAACPVAFGEVSVNSRVKYVLHYKKTAFWIIIAAVVVCAVTAVCFLTNPVTEAEPDLSFLNYENAVSTVADRLEVTVIHYPPAEKDEHEYFFGIGAADGADLAEYLDLADWKECRKPQGKLHSPGSVQFVIEDDWRITVYNRRGLSAYASVEYQGETRFYRAAWGDYAKAAAFCHSERRDLTLDDVMRLAEEKGEELTWSDFEYYNYNETGSGLYIRVYGIDEMFSLAIGGGYQTDDAPMYIYLSANVREDARIDIRYEDPAAFIEHYRSESVCRDCSYGWQCSPVGYSPDILTRMSMDAIASSAVESQVKALPVQEVHNREELKKFMDSMADVMDFDRRYGEETSFRDTLALYDTEFFENSILFLVYIIALDTACRYEMEYAQLEEGALELGIARAEYTGGDTMMEGWLMAVGIPADQLGTLREVSARVVASYDPEAVMPEVLDTYIACIPDPSEINRFMLPSVTLYEDGTYMFFFSPISSHIGHGSYTMTEDRLELYSDGGDMITYAFDVTDGELIFDAASSSEMLWYSDITDGTVFEKVYTLPEGVTPAFSSGKGLPVTDSGT
ncbi:MAG: hypothetical protein IJ480_11320 [Clostridia bacterium]|nr:hypothetical protein [Clostridia bacterium]